MDAKRKFMSKVIKNQDGCWLWAGSKKKSPKPRDDYGYTSVTGKLRLAHRVSYELHIGEIPPGMNVCHKCDTPSCVCPDHLFLGTQLDNIKDMVAKGRHGRKGTIGVGEQNQSAKLTDKDVRSIRELKHSMGTRQIAAQFGVGITCIWKVITGRTWKHVL